MAGAKSKRWSWAEAEKAGDESEASMSYPDHRYPDHMGPVDYQNFGVCFCFVFSSEMESQGKFLSRSLT